MFIGVLILSGLIFLGLQLVQKDEETAAPVETPTVTQTPEQSYSIKDLTITQGPKGEGHAVIQIKDISTTPFSATASEDSKTLTYVFPSATLAMEKRMFPAPHPLIQLIEVSELTDQAQAGTQVKLSFNEPVLATNQTVETLLTIDIEKIEVLAQEPTPQAKAISPVSKPKPKIKKSTSTVKKPVIIDEPLVQDKGFIDDLAVPEQQAATTTTPPIVKEEQAPSSNEFPVDDLLGSPSTSSPIDELPIEPPLAEKSVGMLPQQDIDMGKITSGMPSIDGVVVSNQAGLTRIVVQRSKRVSFKVLPQRNPNRLVVDFLNAVNRLPKDQGGVPGTKVSKITSEQFVGPEGTISRLTFYLNGALPGKNDLMKENREREFILDIP